MKEVLVKTEELKKYYSVGSQVGESPGRRGF